MMKRMDRWALTIGFACMVLTPFIAVGGTAKKSTKATPPKRVPDVVVCLKCGDIKGSVKCCVMEGRTLCPDCGLIKGSFICCKLPKGIHADKVLICPKCGEFLGFAKCCPMKTPDANVKETCPLCHRNKGSIGCCLTPDAQGRISLCARCGEVFGSDKCCSPQGKEKCPKCGLFKGSPGCCKLPKGTQTEKVSICPTCGEILGSARCCPKETPDANVKEKCPLCDRNKDSIGCCLKPNAQGEIALCLTCGEIMGSDKCCKPEGREKCQTCGLFKGSPGCCKLPEGLKKSEVALCGKCLQMKDLCTCPKPTQPQEQDKSATTKTTTKKTKTAKTSDK